MLRPLLEYQTGGSQGIVSEALRGSSGFFLLLRLSLVHDDFREESKQANLQSCE